MLKIQNLHAYYGKSHVLHGVEFGVGEGEIVALLGRNGSGRSTTAKAIMGMVDCTGTVEWRGQQTLGRKPYEIAHLGIGYVPETRESSPNHRAPELELVRKASAAAQARWSFDDSTDVPAAERRHTPRPAAVRGEQQMLNLCRTLMGDPDLIYRRAPKGGAEIAIGCPIPAEAQGARHLRADDRAEVDHRDGISDGPW